jgi:acetyltransferase-like isoleucine patch superfamily enzyme
VPGRLALLRDALRRAVREEQVRQESYTTERLTMGRGSYGAPLIPTYPGDTARVVAGSFVSIAHDVVLLDGGDHRIDWVTTVPLRAVYGLPGAYADGHPRSRGDLVIGNDVWIGRGARVRGGLTIGDGAVIGGYAVVTRDVRPYAIVAGHPAREIRRRFGDDQVEALLRIAWWDWPMDDILAAADELCGGDVDAFIARHRPGGS